MQQGHPRHKQLNRADHEMYLHNRHKAEGVWNAIKNVIAGINALILKKWTIFIQSVK